MQISKEYKERYESLPQQSMQKKKKKIEGNKRMGKLEISSRKLEIPREKGNKLYGPKRSRRY